MLTYKEAEGLGGVKHVVGEGGAQLGQLQLDGLSQSSHAGHRGNQLSPYSPSSDNVNADSLLPRVPRQWKEVR